MKRASHLVPRFKHPQPERTDVAVSLPRELELKLAVPDGSLDPLGDHAALLHAQPEQQRHEVTTYFDTPDRALEKIFGAINDAVTATRLADCLSDDTRPDPAPAVGALASQLASQRNEALHHLTKRWRTFHTQSCFWI